MGSFEISPSKNFSLLFKRGETFDLILDINSLKGFTNLSFVLSFDVNTLKLSSVSSDFVDLQMDYKSTEMGTSFNLASFSKIQSIKLTLSFTPINNGEGYIYISNPQSDLSESFFVKPIYYKISQYPRIFDFNDDKIVNDLDFSIFKETFNLKSTDRGFNSRCDLNFDGVVDEKTSLFCKHFGEVYP